MKNNFKKIAFGDSFKMRFSVVIPFLIGIRKVCPCWARKVLYTFLHHKVFIFFFILCLLPLKLPAADTSPLGDSKVTISMDFQDANLKDVIKILSIQSGLNFIASEAVQDRRITLFLDKVPIKEAMDKLFKANNLTYELDEAAKIFIVKDWGKPELETITKVYYLKYRSVPSARLETEETNLLQPPTATTAGTTAGTTAATTAATPAATTAGTTAATTAGTTAATTADIVTSIKQILSSTGKIAEDTHTNSLIITDIPSRFPVIEQVIAKLDVPVLQVMLEVEMLDVSKNTVDKMGFEFGEQPFTLLMPNASFKRGMRFFLGNVANRGAGVISPTSAGAIVWGNVYGQALDFLRTQTDTKYLARPRLLTLNNETAEISIAKDEVVGKEDTTTISSGITTISTIYKRSTDLVLLKDKGTGIYLRVTPQINPETNEITMVINPTSSVTIPSPIGTDQLDAEIRSTKSVVKIKDGETVILGGLIHTDKQVTTKKIPILGDIPFLGALFRHKDQTRDLERELLVFITPHIVKDTNMRIAKAEKVNIPMREQSAASVTERQLSIEATLNSFEKIK